MADRAAYELEAANLAKKAASVRALISTKAAYRRLLCDENGKLSHDARLVLGDLARTAKMGSVQVGADNDQLRERGGMRALVLHIFARLDPDALDQLASSLRTLEG